MTEVVPGWNSPLKRMDGLTIEYDPTYKKYTVLSNDFRPDIDSCPCCDKPLLTVRACQLVANGLYPLKELSP